MTKYRYIWRGIVKRVIDGDTIEVMVDKGYDQYELMRLRLMDIDTPELRPRKKGRTEDDLHKERLAANVAKAFLEGCVGSPEQNDSEGEQVIFESFKKSFNRYVSIVWLADGDEWPDTWETSLNALMVEAGHAVKV